MNKEAGIKSMWVLDLFFLIMLFCLTLSDFISTTTKNPSIMCVGRELLSENNIKLLICTREFLLFFVPTPCSTKLS